MADRNARVRLVPIVPGGPITNFDRGRLVSRMNKLGLDIVRRAADYPTAQTSYRRTGELGRRWTKRGPSLTAGGLVVEIGNNMSYAARVMGFEKDGDNVQLGLFRGLGWISIVVIGQEMVDAARPDIQRALQGV